MEQIYQSPIDLCHNNIKVDRSLCIKGCNHGAVYDP